MLDSLNLNTLESEEIALHGWIYTESDSNVLESSAYVFDLSSF